MIVQDETRAEMSADELRAALDTLGWSRAEAARRLSAPHRQRVSEWARGAREMPPYYAAHVRTLLREQLLIADVERLRTRLLRVLTGGREPDE